MACAHPAAYFDVFDVIGRPQLGRNPVGDLVALDAFQIGFLRSPPRFVFALRVRVPFNALGNRHEVGVGLASRNALRLVAFQAFRPRLGHAERREALGGVCEALAADNGPPRLAAFLEGRHCRCTTDRMVQMWHTQRGIGKDQAGILGKENGCRNGKLHV